MKGVPGLARSLVDLAGQGCGGGFIAEAFPTRCRGDTIGGEVIDPGGTRRRSRLRLSPGLGSNDRRRRGGCVLFPAMIENVQQGYEFVRRFLAALDRGMIVARGIVKDVPPTQVVF